MAAIKSIHLLQAEHLLSQARAMQKFLLLLVEEPGQVYVLVIFLAEAEQEA